MIEPAIGITATAIATLRPLFANFLSFATNHPNNDSETSLADSTRMSGESKGRNSGQEYSPEFAEMLGLKRLGTTTHISARKPPGWRERRRIAMFEKIGAGDCESQTELSSMETYQSNFHGIRTTTIIFVEKE